MSEVFQRQIGFRSFLIMLDPRVLAGRDPVSSDDRCLREFFSQFLHRAPNGSTLWVSFSISVWVWVIDFSSHLSRGRNDAEDSSPHALEKVLFIDGTVIVSETLSAAYR